MLTTGLEFKVFRGVGAVIAQVKSDTQFSVLAVVKEDVKVDFSATERLFEVNLEATPTNVPWSEVLFDDRGVDSDGNELPAQRDGVSPPLGITTLGSGKANDMTDGAFVGGVYVEDSHYKEIYSMAIALPNDPEPWPPVRFKLYQLTSVAYSMTTSDPRAGHRYHGFLGRVTGVLDRTITVVFTQQNGNETGPLAFNLDDADACDNDPPAAALNGEISITKQPIVAGTKGAFFVALQRAAEFELSGPKLPIGLD